eukprot:TRINITY_DN17584_c0_g2_i1.p1 TRINITY_DN17584_c0_g2~~TRINITY_DN17584_c0_g2_i1.p1  ORF type:complete len:199 (-),score=27.95 TRINITY_DN17584_c0_g2_i1:783-1379(-)
MAESTTRLAQAAAELVKAAQVETARISASNAADSLAELKKIRGSSEESGGDLKRLCTQLDKDVKQGNAEMQLMRAEMMEVKEELKKSNKAHQIRTLQWGWENATINAFNYYDSTEMYSQSFSSSGFLQACLIAFMSGKGCYLGDRTTAGTTYHSTEETKRTGREDFQARIVRQIRAITGLEAYCKVASEEGLCLYLKD